MDRCTRRSILLTGTSVLLAGCTGSGSGGNDGSSNGGSLLNQDDDDDGVPNDEDDYPNDPNYSRRQENWIRDADNIPEDEWIVWEFTASKRMRLKYDLIVRDGPRIDMFLTSPDEYNHFQNGDRFKVFDALQELDTGGASGEDAIASGEYVLVLDNSNRGEARPPTNFSDDIARVEITVHASV